MSGQILPYLGKMPVLHARVWLAETAVVIGDTEIAAGSGIWYGSVVRGDVNEIRIGAETNVQDGTVIHVAAEGQGTYIGNRVTIGHQALIHACTIEDEVLIGMKSCVMDGAVVETGAIVAAGALVTPGKRVGKGQLWAGSPARHVRDVSEDEAREIQVLADRYVMLAGQYIDSQR